MGPLGKILLGFFVGILCGIIPMAYCLIKKQKIAAIIGLLVVIFSGILFSALDKSPFIAFVVSALFILIIIANNKRNKNEEEEDNTDNDDFL